MNADILVDLTPLDTFSRYSGTGRYVRDLSQALSALTPAERHGLSIGGLVSLDGEHAVGALDWSGSADIRWPLAREVAWLMARRTRLPFTLRRARPRLFHATYSLGTPRGSGVPRVVTCLDLVPLVFSDEYLPGRGVYRRALRAVEALRYHTARRVQAISRNTADELIRLLHIPASRIDIVYLGVDLERYRAFEGDDLAHAEAVRRQYGLEKPYVFYIGAADPRKNVDVLVAAFAQARVDDLELVLIGKPRPSDRQAFDRALAAANHPRGVRFLGFVPEPDLPAVIAGGVAFVCCSTHEGFPNVHLEAMACGCPTITPGETSMRETLGDAVLQVPARNVSATADAIRRVAREAALRRQLSEAGVRCAPRFTLRDTALATVESYALALR